MFDFGTSRKYKQGYKAGLNLAFVASEQDAIKELKYLSYKRNNNSPYLRGLAAGIEDGLQRKLEEKALKLQQEKDLKKFEEAKNNHLLEKRLKEIEDLKKQKMQRSMGIEKNF